MRRVFAALVLILAVVGCDGDYDADVRRAGGESVTVDATGLINAKGTVVNTGDGKAYDVVLHFSFSRNGDVYLRQDLLLGDISHGSARSYSATFAGPPVDPATFGWDFTIEWD
jgi:hypothetical protein